MTVVYLLISLSLPSNLSICYSIFTYCLRFLQPEVHPYNHVGLVTIKTKRPNFAGEWVAILLRIREDMGSNFGPETAYLN
jgi:hypothetical protein